MILEEDVSVLTNKPEAFKPIFEVSALYIHVEGHFLYLQKADNGSFQGQWSVPAGKTEEGESLEKALLREVFEETGILLKDFQFLKSLYVCYPEFDFIFHPFISKWSKRPDVRLSSEHKSFSWLPLSKAKKLDLIPGGRQIIEELFN